MNTGRVIEKSKVLRRRLLFESLRKVVSRFQPEKNAQLSRNDTHFLKKGFLTDSLRRVRSEEYAATLSSPDP